MIQRLFRKMGNGVERGFYIESSRPLSPLDLQKVRWLVSETFEPGNTGLDPFLPSQDVVEIGPRLTIETPFSSNAVAMCQAMGLNHVTRFERTNRYLVGNGQSRDDIFQNHFDRMTEAEHPGGIMTFDTGIVPEDVRVVDLMGRGKEALHEVNASLGLGMDAPDIDYYMNYFVGDLKRNPTDVELFQLANANGEHCRHWYFRGLIVIDGVPMPLSLFEVVQKPLKHLGNDTCSLVAFRDNAGVIRGFETYALLPVNPGKPSELHIFRRMIHHAATAETHNHPTFWSPYNGATTGSGGRRRDSSAVGRGGIPGVGFAGYFGGNLDIPGYPIPGEVVGIGKFKNASPLQIILEGSDGVSDDGNQYGEALTGGFTRTFGQMVDGEWREPRKPILYSGGIGRIYGQYVDKEKAEVGMFIVRIGGPAYPVGVGGGAASGMASGQNTEQLDFNSVQRGNSEMANRVYRAIQACVEMEIDNPISSLHDQGAGGPSNLLTELIELLGGFIHLWKMTLGDKTMSFLKMWSAEFQEGFGLLIRKHRLRVFQEICHRERVNCEVLGEVDGSGKVVVEASPGGQRPVNLDLDRILTDLPRKRFESTRKPRNLPQLELPDIPIGEAIEAVFKLPQVGSKGFLVHKVDRSVGGLVVQQQCCGIAQIPIADVSVNALSHFDLRGTAGALGEQPILMLIDPKAGARMAVAEMLTNMASVVIDSQSVRCRANWMWPAKKPHEGALIWDAANAMAEFMIEVGVAVDGGKDSLSMETIIEGQSVKSPGCLVILGYAPVPDITRKVTPDIKKPGQSKLFMIDLGQGKNRLGGSSLAQAWNQLGNEAPDIDDPQLFKRYLSVMQKMIGEGMILARHDRSGGGLITTVAEMCMASRCGFKLNLPAGVQTLACLFNEEAGCVLEVEDTHEEAVRNICASHGVPLAFIGRLVPGGACSITTKSGEKWKSTISKLRTMWECTSSRLEELQTNPGCAKAEHREHSVALPGAHTVPSYHVSFTPKDTSREILEASDNPRVAIVREEGSNGDREMQAACLAAGLAPWDVTMSDLLEGRITLDSFRGVIFPGGFSFKDVCDSAKGWAGTILFNDRLREMFDRFYAREDTFSLGICNGCQLMALLGWVPEKGIQSEKQPRFVHNLSGRFESRWVQVEILPSPSILLKGMVGSKLGVWSAHGEGRLVYPDESIEKEVVVLNLSPFAFLDPQGFPTNRYPYNPNGSKNGSAGLCSKDGRHLAFMLHLERVFRLWQWPWMPSSWNSLEASPWLQVFQNARQWCVEHRA